MVLNYTRGLAQDFAGTRSTWNRTNPFWMRITSNSVCFPLIEQTVKDAVITVPAYFNQAERRAVLQAAHMAGLKVLQLINDNSAVALNYGVFRRKDINSTAQVKNFEI